MSTRPDELPNDVVSSMVEEDYEQLIEDYTHFLPPEQGELLRGTVLKVTDTEVIVDFGYKSEGVVPLEEFRKPDGTIEVKEGDEIDVIVARPAARTDGYVELSYRRAVRRRAWANLEKAYRENLLVSAYIVSRVKGGFLVDVGVPAFMPASHVDIRPVSNLEAFVGQITPVKVVKLGRKRGNVVVSRRLAIEQEIEARRQAILEALQEGDIVAGTVKTLTDYGAFIDLGGIDGLLHISDISYGRLQHPSEVLSEGQEISVKILKVDREKGRVAVGLKQLLPDPWETVAERYPVGSRVVGRVVNLTDYGAFVELEPGVEGLIHITEMTWSRHLKHPSKVFKVGDVTEAVVLDVKPEEHRISLSLKRLEPDPWTTVAERYSVGSIVEGRVRKVTDTAVFVEVEEGIEARIHISELSRRRVNHPSEVVKKGQVVKAAVVQIDPANRRMALSMKELEPDEWEEFCRTHQVGDVVRGKVTRVASFGVFVEVAPRVEGLCHNSEIPPMPDRQPNEPPLPIGLEREFKIIRLNEAERRLGLSIKALAEDEERSRLEQYQRQAAAATMTLEEAIQLKQGRLR